MPQTLHSTVTAVQSPVEVARALVPLLAQQAGQAEKDRRATDTSIEALRAAGLFQMMFPRRSGGVGHQLITQVETIAALAKGVGIDESDKNIVFCNTGHWASIAWFALSEVAGNKHARMYDGSMAEWASDPARPIEDKTGS